MRQTLGFAFAAACAVALSIVGGNLAAQAPAAGAQQPPAGQQPAEVIASAVYAIVRSRIGSLLEAPSQWECSP